MSTPQKPLTKSQYDSLIKSLSGSFRPDNTYSHEMKDMTAGGDIRFSYDLNELDFGKGNKKFILIFDDLKVGKGRGVYLGEKCDNILCPKQTCMPQYTGMGLSYLFLCIAVIVIIYMFFKLNNTG